MPPLPTRERRRPSRFEDSSEEEEREMKHVPTPVRSGSTTPSTGEPTVADDGGDEQDVEGPSKRDDPSDEQTSLVDQNEEEGVVPISEDTVAATVTEEEQEGASEPKQQQQQVPSQVSLSQSEDDHIRDLDKSGALSHIVGSQSILTQELHDTGATHNEDDEDDDGTEPAVPADDSSTNKNHAYEAAKNIGLLTQEYSPRSPTDEDQQDESQATESSPQEPPVVVEEEKATTDSKEQEQPVVVEDEKSSNTTSQEQVPPTLQLSQLSCLMDAAEVLQHREEKQINEQLICAEDLPDDELFDFDNDEEEHETPVPVPSTYSPKLERPPSLSSARVSKIKGSRVKAPQLPLSYNNKRKTFPNHNGSLTGNKLPKYTGLSPQKRRKLEKQAEQARAQSLAKRAAALAERTSKSPEVAKQLLLSMALVRTNPRTAPTTWPPSGSVIPEGFYWATYPPLENVLRSHMREYYELSTTKCQSRDQQAFNNSLVITMRNKARQFGWTFHDSFDDKKLRDRIRCFFKTHIQNAKKRLKTMVKNPTKRANAKALVQHLDLIQQYIPNEEDIRVNLGLKPQTMDEAAETRVAAMALSGFAKR